MTDTSPDTYGPIAIVLHWMTAALIFALFVLGWWMTALPLSPQKLELYALHKSLGIAVLALSAIRLVCRLAFGGPKPVDGPIWQQRAATGAHGLLYVFLFALPLSGWLFNSLIGFPLSVFGLFELPSIAAPDSGMKEIARLTHVWCGWTLLILIGLHVGAALFHQFVRRDRIFQRILPRCYGPKSVGEMA